MIQFGKDICQNLESALQKEWLETNGIGGFASSTIVGLNTRRYHGLLVAATKPPVGRIVMLSKLEETLVVNDQRYELSANEYAATIHPLGHQFLQEFRLDPFPVFLYAVNGIEIEKSLFLIHGENTVAIRYRIVSGDDPDVRLEVRPLIAFRDYHSTMHQNDSLNAGVRREKGLAIVEPYAGLPALYLAHTAKELDPSNFWYRNFEYRVEKERGLDFSEDLFSPFALHFEIGKGRDASLLASTEPHHANHWEEHRKTEIDRRKAVAAMLPSKIDNEMIHSLVAAADQYIVSRGDQKTVIAGYHWFSDWGRDTMIALPGLTLATGRPEIARSILLAFSQHVDQGMLPNRFPDAGEQPEYNTVDATLWFFEACRSLLHYTADYEFIRMNLYEALSGIIDWHVRGTRYGIRMDQDGLLLSGEPGVQLTWMDAKIGDWVVTPRHGKAVEIQALWYNALRIMEHLADRFGDVDGKKKFRELASLAYGSFQPLFWNDSSGCLYDVVNGQQKDSSIRPNQIFAISLFYPILESGKAKAVAAMVERHLLTPYGLRSLSPEDPQYRPHYEGDPRSRDSAYHQGTVWGWLMGPFLTAYVKVHGGTKVARKKAAQWLTGFQNHMLDAGLGQISEIFDADPPHRPVGCIAQAWSVAEILRAAMEDILT